MVARRRAALGTATVFAGAVRAPEAIGFEDALSYCFGAAVIAVQHTWIVSS